MKFGLLCWALGSKPSMYPWCMSYLIGSHSQWAMLRFKAKGRSLTQLLFNVTDLIIDFPLEPLPVGFGRVLRRRVAGRRETRTTVDGM